MGKKRKRSADIDADVIEMLHLKPTARQVRKRRWLQVHWDFMQKNRVDPVQIKSNLPGGLPTRAAHGLAILRALHVQKGVPLEVVNLSQSVHRASACSGLVMPCITPNGQFWVERLSRTISPAEKLLCMGLPLGCVDMGGLSSGEIQSLAGNAMHVWASLSARTRRMMSHAHFHAPASDMCISQRCLTKQSFSGHWSRMGLGPMRSRPPEAAD